jgi:hypothetical protein
MTLNQGEGAAAEEHASRKVAKSQNRATYRAN